MANPVANDFRQRDDCFAWNISAAFRRAKRLQRFGAFTRGLYIRNGRHVDAFERAS